jgi:hypothetical protein
MRFEERRIIPPRLVSVFWNRTWRPAHLLAWRRLPAAYRYLVQFVNRDRKKSGIPPRWVDPRIVRPRRGRAVEEEEVDQRVDGPPAAT